MLAAQGHARMFEAGAWPASPSGVLQEYCKGFV